ncbi:MAG: hypothetical protein OEW93_11880, partial [Candidatus Bathyarchaeota archaeon]|nr:hypothetical protein [Candidatus Bathyarchaeota archaeon]
MEADIPPGSDIDLDEALNGAKDIIERRINEFGVAESEITRQGGNRIAVQLPGIEPDEALDKIGRTALLQFCQAVEDDAGNFAVVEGGKAVYEPHSCEPERDEAGNILTDPGATILFLPQEALYDPQNPDVRGTDDVVWTPAKANLKGVETELTGRFLERNTFVTADPITGRPNLVFNLNSDGAGLFEQITERLLGKPLTFFLDGEPILGADGHIIAPGVQSVISDQGQITGLTL